MEAKRFVDAICIAGLVKSKGCPVYVVTAGREPPEFTSLFPYWEDVPEARECSAHVREKERFWP